MVRRAYQDEQGHLKLPPLEKQFLISPPASPPVGWEQVHEMAPVVCDFDLMSRLAAYAVDDKCEVHGGDNNQPTIIVTPAAKEEFTSGLQTPFSGKASVCHTPRPPKREINTTAE